MANGKGLRNRIPVFSKDYIQGVKQGTHIFGSMNQWTRGSYVQIRSMRLYGLEWKPSERKIWGQVKRNESNKWIVEKVQNGRR